MTKEREHELISAAQAGDIKARDAILTQYYPFINRYSSKFKYLDTIELKEVYQECVIFAIEAIYKFDISKDTKFGTYLGLCLQQVTRYIVYNDQTIKPAADYEQRIKKGEIERFEFASLDAPYTHEDNQQSGWIDQLVIEDEATNTLDAFGLNQLYDALDSISPTNRDLLIMRHLYSTSLEHIRQSYKVGRIALDRMIADAEYELALILQSNYSIKGYNSLAA